MERSMYENNHELPPQPLVDLRATRAKPAGTRELIVSPFANELGRCSSK